MPHFVSFAAGLAAGFLFLTVAMVSPAEAARTCKDGHWHDGAGAYMPTKSAAMKSAIEYWAGYTAAEYGTAWASYSRSADRSARCFKSDDGTRWQCIVEGRPCRA